jgi:DNA-binding GntR family transcriptional regulator
MNAPIHTARRPARPRVVHGPSSPDQVVEALVKGLQAGRYVPGQRLIEADLTKELKVSRGPVREALKRLAAEGLVSLIPHRGAYIRAVSRAEVHDLLLVQEMLTGLGARLAAGAVGLADHRETFEAAFQRLMGYSAHPDTPGFLEARARFYDTLIRIGGNRELRRLTPIRQIHLLRAQFQGYMSKNDHARQFAEYAALAKAILAGDQTEAERAMRRHIRRARLAIERLPEGAFSLGP